MPVFFVPQFPAVPSKQPFRQSALAQYALQLLLVPVFRFPLATLEVQAVGFPTIAGADAVVFPCCHGRGQRLRPHGEVVWSHHDDDLQQLVDDQRVHAIGSLERGQKWLFRGLWINQSHCTWCWLVGCWLCVL
jgi:hypothetical protein